MVVAALHSPALADGRVDSAAVLECLSLVRTRFLVLLTTYGKMDSTVAILRADRRARAGEYRRVTPLVRALLRNRAPARETPTGRTFPEWLLAPDAAGAAERLLGALVRDFPAVELDLERSDSTGHLPDALRVAPRRKSAVKPFALLTKRQLGRLEEGNPVGPFVASARVRLRKLQVPSDAVADLLAGVGLLPLKA